MSGQGDATRSSLHTFHHQIPWMGTLGHVVWSAVKGALVADLLQTHTGM